MLNEKFLTEALSGENKKKFLDFVKLDDFECRVVVNCLNEMQNTLIANGKYTDAVDDVILKIIDVKQKESKAIYKKGGLDYGKVYL